MYILNAFFSYLHTNFLDARPNNGTDEEDGDLKGAKNETKVPNFQPLADSLARIERSLTTRFNASKVHNMSIGHLHGDTHGIAEIDNDEGDDGEPLLLREGRHGGLEANLQL